MLTHDQLLADVGALDARLAGSAVGPGDPRWDEARTAWNLAVDQRPAAVAIVHDADDVVAVVDFARARGLRVAAQGTGHAASAMSTLDGTILVKTHEMRGVEIDPIARRARVQAGALWADVTVPAAEHRLVPPLGSSPDVGVVGFTLGGGFCWVGRKHGLASNNVHAVEIVLADGSRVRATADHEADLFWAVRGGGGSFGVVTAIELELFDEPEIFASSMFFPAERGAEIVHAWRTLTRALPEDATAYVRFLQVPPLPDIPEPLRGRSWVNLEVVHLGDEVAGRQWSDPIRALGPEVELGGMMDAAALNHFHMDPEHPVPALGGAHMLLDELTEEAVDAFVAVGGAASRSPLVVLGAAPARRRARPRARGRRRARPPARRGLDVRRRHGDGRRLGRRGRVAPREGHGGDGALGHRRALPEPRRVPVRHAGHVPAGRLRAAAGDPRRRRPRPALPGQPPDPRGVLRAPAA
jgi:FAD/FMN-containing dehydrogenase